MAKDTRTATAARNAAVDAICALLDNGYLRIYDGTKPADANTAVSTQTLLAELRFNADAFAAAASGSAAANAITDDSSANATGTATWFRALASDGTTVVFDGTVGTSDANLVLGSVAIQSGARVSITSLTYAMPSGSSQ